MSTRDRNGGLLELSELLRLLGKLRDTNNAAAAINEDDVVRAIKTLKPLGAGYDIISVGGRKMVRSVPRELDADQAVVLSVARDAGAGGRVVESMLV